MSGEVVHVGRACPADPRTGPVADDPFLVDPDGRIALIQPGACRFDHQVARAHQAGAVGAIVYGLEGDESLILMGGDNPVTMPDGTVVDTEIPAEVGARGSIEQIDTYAIPEAQDPDFALGFGDLCVHEVATDPRPGSKVAYFSYYAGGFRVAEYGNEGIQEVGAFIDEGGSNVWGVEVHEHPDGQYYVLASDRDYGLYILQYTGEVTHGNAG